jgi:hypothetical protein
MRTSWRAGDYLALISIGPTETMHFQIWSDKASNGPPLTAFDPVTGLSGTFPDLSDGGELFQKNSTDSANQRVETDMVRFF